MLLILALFLSTLLGFVLIRICLRYHVCPTGSRQRGVPTDQATTMYPNVGFPMAMTALPAPTGAPAKIYIRTNGPMPVKRNMRFQEIPTGVPQNPTQSPVPAQHQMVPMTATTTAMDSTHFSQVGPQIAPLTSTTSLLPEEDIEEQIRKINLQAETMPARTPESPATFWKRPSPAQ